MRSYFSAIASAALLGVVLLVAPLAAQTQHHAASRQTEDAGDGLTSLLYKTKAGMTLNYVQQGNPAGPVIVLLHGAGDSWHSYDREFALIPRRYLVYAITLRGHGLSDHPEKGFTSADFAGDILDFLDAKNIHHATLVGHSLGSFVAQKLAELDTDHLDRLVLIGSGPGLLKPGADPNALSSWFMSVKDPIPYTFARDFQASTIYFPVPAANFEVWVSEAEKVPASTWHGLAVKRIGTVEDLKKIRVPTLLMWGEKDSIFKRADEDELLKDIAHVQLSVYPETGHALHWERPERFTRELLSFIEKGSVAGSVTK